ncbi:MAG: WD40 repeat domain-containing protein [Gaiellaceae bacterium]
MSDRDLRADLLSVPVPGELEAQRRAWRVVEAAYAEREELPRRRRSLRPVLALAVVAAVVAAALSPPGRSVGGWIQERVAGEPDAEPALVRLPGPGTLLVAAERGPWIVRPDGSKRFLGDYEDASFSPQGLFVVATAGRRVVALEPDGDPRWSLARPKSVADARWAPSPGFHVAYREGGTLRVVAGDGTSDRLLAREVAPVAPAWLPRAGRTELAYAGADGVVRVVDVESGEELLRTPRTRRIREVFWTPDGLLAVLTSRELRVHDRRGRLLRLARVAPGHELLDAVGLGDGEVVYADFDPEARATVFVHDYCFVPGACRLIGPSQVFRGAGHLQDLALSPDGRWLLAGWPEADQLLFLRLPGVGKIVAVDDVRREFDPGGTARGAFPRLAGWCCQ